MGSEIFKIFTQNPYMLDYCFTEKKTQFMAKTDWNSVFLDHVAHMPDRLYIIVSYMSFYGFYFFKKIHSKSIGPTVLLKIISLLQKLTKTLYFFVAIPILWIGYT
jgi:hypothetical protein